MTSSSSTTPTQSPHNPEGPSFSDFGITDSGELYAKNNTFQRSGPIGAVERISMAKNDKIYLRVDMPGVPKECLYLTLNPDNIVICGGLAPIECEGDHGRFYGVSYGLRSYKLKKPQANISNGVVRMKISKQKSKNAARCSNSPSLDEELKKDELSFYVATNPSETEGPKESYGAKKVKEGLYVWVDKPGVTKEKVSVGVEDGFVVFSGEAVNESNHGESGITYKGRFGPFDVTEIGEIKTKRCSEDVDSRNSRLVISMTSGFCLLLLCLEFSVFLSFVALGREDY